MRITATILATLALAGGTARAGVEAARRYVAASGASLDARDFGDAAAQLELAEAELDGVDAAAQTPVVATIAGLRERIGSAARVRAIEERRGQLAQAVAGAGAAVGDLDAWDGASKQLRAMLDDPAVVALIPDEASAARGRLAAFTNANGPKAAAARVARAEAAVAALEAKWTHLRPSFGGPESADEHVEPMIAALMAARRAIDAIPAADGARLMARVDVVGEAFARLALPTSAMEQLASLREAWESWNWEWSDWRDERLGVTLDDLRRGHEEAFVKLNAGQTVALVKRADEFLAARADDAAYQAVASDPSIRAIVEPIRADRDAARARLEGFATRLLDEADGATLDDPARAALRRFADGLDTSLAGSPKRAEMAARARSLADGPATRPAGQK